MNAESKSVSEIIQNSTPKQSSNCKMFLYLQRFKRKANARMVKLVDTLVSGTSDRKVVQVRVLFRAPKRVRNSSLFYFTKLLHHPRFFVGDKSTLGAFCACTSCNAHTIVTQPGQEFLYAKCGLKATNPPAPRKVIPRCDESFCAICGVSVAKTGGRSCGCC